MNLLGAFVHLLLFLQMQTEWKFRTICGSCSQQKKNERIAIYDLFQVLDFFTLTGPSSLYGPLNLRC